MNKQNQNPKTQDLRPSVLVTGANGQLGHKIAQLLTPNYSLILTDSDNMDITDKKQILKITTSKKPDIIIHGAAYTQVDLAEDSPALCEKINSEGTKNLAEAAHELDIPIIYISTDYVFDGKQGQGLGLRAQDLVLRKNSFTQKDPEQNPKTQDLRPKPYREKDTPHPLSVYGKTKLEGEDHIQNICKKYYIIRASWLFGELPENHHGTNFVETMLRLGKERDRLSIVNDQIGSPTYTKDLVGIIDRIIRTHNSGFRTQNLGLRGNNFIQKSQGLEPKTQDLSPKFNPVPYGIYHFSGTGACSWYDFAKEIFDQSQVKINLAPITSDQYPQKAKRPAYSYMSKAKIEKALDISVRPWQEMLREYLDNKSI